MTVRELKEALNKFDDNCLVFVEKPYAERRTTELPYKEVTHISRSINETDFMVILDDYEEEDE